MADRRKATSDAVGARPERALVHRAASAEIFDLHRLEVGGPLAEFVEHLWRVTWDRRGLDAVESAVIPFPSMHLTLEWGDGERHGHPLPSTLVHGVVTSLFRVELAGAGGVLGVRFRPGGLAAFFDVDVAVLADRAVPASTVVGHELAHAIAALLAIEDHDDRARALVDLLTVRTAAPSGRYLRLRSLVEEMRDDPTLQRVDQLPERCGWTVRAIQRVFRHDLGAGPKWVLARYRLQEAALAIEEDPDVDLAGLAASLGWYDQAHFTNEFRRIVGSTPGEYAATAAAARSSTA